MRFRSLLLGCLATLRVALAGVTELDAASVSERDVSPVVAEENVYEVLESRSIASEILERIKSAATCAGCNAVFVLLKALAAFGDRVFVSTIQEICKLSNVWGA